MSAIEPPAEDAAEQTEPINGHLVTIREVGPGEQWRAVCVACHAERRLSTEFLAFRCGRRAETWSFAAVLMGSHRHVTVRHGREGSRALCGTLVLDEGAWPELRDALAELGEVREAEA